MDELAHIGNKVAVRLSGTVEGASVSLEGTLDLILLHQPRGFGN